MYHSLYCRGIAKVRAQSCSEEYDKLFIAASTTEGQPRVELTATMKKYNNSMYHSLHCRGTAKVRGQSCSDEYDKLFIAASTTEGQPRVVLTDALKNIITLFIRAFITE